MRYYRSSVKFLDDESSVAKGVTSPLADASVLGGSPPICNPTVTGSLQRPDLPIVVVNALNAILVVLAVIVAVIAGIRLAPSLVELLEES